jgi:hypothetical protein
MIKEFINKFKAKYIGNLKYVVTSINVSLSVNISSFNSLVELNEFVNEINNEKYWMIQKIEKIRTFDFKYNENIKHTPLHFYKENVTEIYDIEDYEYRFLKKDNSLCNIKRTLTKSHLN